MPRKLVAQQAGSPRNSPRRFRRRLRAARHWWIGRGVPYSEISARLMPPFVIRNRDMKPLLHKGKKP